MDSMEQIFSALVRIEEKLDKITAARTASPSSPAPPPAKNVFPPYGRSKGAPIRGASIEDLEYYAAGARRSLSDPDKSRWHDKDRALLDAINAEIARQEALAGSATDLTDLQRPPPTDDEIPF